MSMLKNPLNGQKIDTSHLFHVGRSMPDTAMINCKIGPELVRTYAKMYRLDCISDCIERDWVVS